MESNYIVTLAYKTYKGIFMISGMVNALDAEESVSKAKDLKRCDGKVVSFTSVSCAEEETTYFSDIIFQ